MSFIEFIEVDSENAVYINSEQVVCVRLGNASGTADIVTTANANGLHVITVEEELSLVVSRLEGIDN